MAGVDLLGSFKKIAAAVKEAKRLCEETRLQRENESPEERAERLAAKEKRISNLIEKKVARKAENTMIHSERMRVAHAKAIARKTQQKAQDANKQILFQQYWCWEQQQQQYAQAWPLPHAWAANWGAYCPPTQCVLPPGLELLPLEPDADADGLGCLDLGA